MEHLNRILGISLCVWFSIFLMGSCNTSQRKDNNHKKSNVAGTSVADQKTPHTDTVLIKDMKFQPEEIKVHRSDTVVWMNKDMVDHCVTEVKSKAWTSGSIPSGASWKLAVTQSSDYYCAIHQVMKGKIVME